MQKRRMLKVRDTGPTLWLQRRLLSRSSFHLTPEEPAVLSPEPEKEVQAPQAVPKTQNPGWAREAKLKRAYAAEYPGIIPEVWIPVGELSAKLIERVRAGRREGRHTRTFDPTHFEFRGGDTGPRPRAARTRSSDPKL